MTEPAPLQQVDRTYVRLASRKLSYFSGCDYFRLASHPQVIAALHQGLDKYGLNVAASRMTSGNHVLYRRLETALASFFDAADALLVPSGYITNLVVAQALAGNFSHVLLDQESHPSLAGAARAFDCPVLSFKHRDPKDVQRVALRCGPGARVMLLTDGMFSRDGSAAPLGEYVAVLPNDAWMLVDDAHAAGLLGETGKGSLEHARIPRRRVIQTITLSKAFGAYGGAILGTNQLRRKIIQRSQAFVGSTPVPLPLANAALAGIAILKRDRSLRQRLIPNLNFVRDELRARGIPITATPGPILTFVPKDPHQASRFRRELLRAGIYPPFIRYPGGPAGGYFRFVISSEHTRQQLNQLVRALVKIFSAK
jgi:8-amino-7-oxononanoate synthase